MPHDPSGTPSSQDSPAILVGCAELPPGLRRVRYFQRRRYLEVADTMYQLPKLSVLSRWSGDAEPNGRFGLLAPQVITHKPDPRGYRRGGDNLAREQLADAGWFRATDLVVRSVEEFARVVRSVPTDAVLFRAPADFSPSAANREALRRFFTDIAPAEIFAGAVRVWEPQGLWEPALAARVAAELGVVYACDPMSNDPLGAKPDFFARLPTRDAYFRLTGLGRARQRFDAYALSTLLETVAAYDRVWIVFANADKYPDSMQLQRILEQ